MTSPKIKTRDRLLLEQKIEKDLLEVGNKYAFELSRQDLIAVYAEFLRVYGKLWSLSNEEILGIINAQFHD